jgi:hypothetical protein
MAAREMTRRSLLTATAGAVAGGLARPGSVLAMAWRPPALDAKPVLFERALGRLPGGGERRTIDLGRNADLIGVLWSGTPAARLELRVREGLDGWSRWVSAGAHGHAPDGAPPSGAPHTGAIVGDPVWTGGGTVVELRSDRALRDVRLSCVDVSDGIGARRLAQALEASASRATLELATPTLPAGAGQPPIIARRAWARGMAPPRVAPEYGSVRMAFVHHTENPNGYSPGEVPAMLRAIYVFHRYVRGWNDIGYNFVIDLFGRIFEARAGGIDEPVIGAHAGGYNYVSTGVAVLGEFTSVPISPAAAGALERLLAWKLSLHGVPSDGRVMVRVSAAGASYSRFPAGARVSLPRIAGHRDGDSTDCPGDVLYGELPAMRPRIHSLAGRVARASIALAAPPTEPSAPAAPGGQATPGAQAAPTPGGEPAPIGQSTTSSSSTQPGEARTLTGSLTLLDGAPIAGAPIQIQAREVSHRGESVQERAIAQVTTSASGAWSLAVNVSPSTHATWLRALCPGAAGGAPTVVSAPLRLPGVLTTASAPAEGAAPAPTTPGPTDGSVPAPTPAPAPS